MTNVYSERAGQNNALASVTQRCVTGDEQHISAHTAAHTLEKEQKHGRSLFGVWRLVGDVDESLRLHENLYSCALPGPDVRR
jgi:hypothetical protein